MKEVKITIKGTTPLLLNRFPLDVHLGENMQGKGKAVAGGEEGTPREQCEKCLYIGADGKTLVVPSPNLMSMITAAGTFFKLGKSKVTTLATSMIPACMEIVEFEVSIIHEKPWDVDARSIRTATGTRVIKYRPIFYDWALSFTLRVDTDMITTKFLREIIDAAGKRIGLGDFRVQRKGPFGKFVVTQWQEVKMEQEIAA